MIGKTDLLASVLATAGVFPLLSRLPSLGGERLLVLAYHRVFDVEDETRFPFDPELISASSSEFRRQVEYLSAHYSPVTLAQVLSALDDGVPLPRRPVVITFDDGYADNYLNAFPVLRSLGVPATVFLSTGYIGGQEPFWFDHVANVLFHAPEGEVTVPGIQGSLRLFDVESRRHASNVVLRYVKRLPNQQRRELIEWLALTLKFKRRDEDTCLANVMTWNQVQEMADAGIEFGSHTVSHPVLSRVDDAMLDYELRESRRSLEERLGRTVETIAYPVGEVDAFDQRVEAAVQRAGYRLGFSYVSGTNSLKQLDRFSLRRLHVERYTSFARFQAMLQFPEVFQ